jgi:hypothetical protein
MRKFGLLLLLLCAALPAQWLQVLPKNTPRTKDGKPDLAAAAPRRADGKPDLTGIWGTENSKYLANIAADFKPGDLPIQPWAEALTRERMTGIHASEESNANCLPQGVPRIDATPNPFKIVQEPDLIVILYEAFGQFRQIYLDGRALPKDPNPTWLGYSVGRWERDTLVVETAGFNGKTWLDQAGHPATDALHVTERYRRRDFGHLDIQVTIDDPHAYTKPWTVTEPMQLLPDTDLIEFVCNENEKDLKHLGKKQAY